jgi:hypothetical protein
MSYILTIDVGLKGGICLGNSEKLEVMYYLPTPEDNSLILKIKELNIKQAILEEQSCRIGQHVKSTFNIAKSYGYWIGVLETLSIPYIIVRPQVWQSIIKKEEISIEFSSLTSKHKSTKLKAASLCKRLFPNLNIITKRGRLLDGLTDSIAMYIWYMNNL